MRASGRLADARAGTALPFSVPVGNTQGVLAYLKEDGVPG
jgi:hypothetical protein